MRILIGAVAVMLLAGCANVADIRSSPPVLSLTSKKSAEQTAECIRDGWQSTSLIGGSVGGVLQKSGGSFSVIAPNAESPWHVADVIPTGGSKSKVVYRFHRNWQEPSDRVLDVVKSCAG
ncbi:hypothetical protein N5D48_05110 [Pseudomonas sp. GD03858]|uniref:hypothetical protein n=1 Tax=unclassified Pseudomonas TaxID=196821 RepID=UPI00244AB471|nr:MULTISPECIES: hypothetical protein [unclassified Pseudomonas]MDH0646228.1 hypothetical protein [Pseudomonas sp. GD03867]MDH0661773.1 hypothetical protein [Pseudomonas sp. GD03858]